MHNYLNSRWRPPPSWILKIGCHFVTIRSIVTKFDKNVENLTKDATIAMKLHIYQKSRWRKPPSWISKIGCHFITIAPIVTKSGGNVENLTCNILLHQKCIFSQIQGGGSRHIEFRKLVAISLLFDQLSPSLMGMLKMWPITQLLH